LLKGKIALLVCILALIPIYLCAQGNGGRWQFENNSDDSADWDQISNNGNLSGAAFYGSESPLIEGDYYLSIADTGQNSFFYVSDNYDLDFGNGDIAISAWIYPLTIDETTQYIVVKGDREATPKSNNYALRLQGEFLNFIVADNTGAAHKVISSFTVPVGQWTFVAAFYDYSDSLVYLWNEQTEQAADTIAYNAKLYPNSNRLYIGAWGRDSDRRFYGRIDDVRIGTTIEDVMTPQVDIHPENREFQYPTRFSLNQNYPNPFNSSTTIKFDLHTCGSVKIEIYNIVGEIITSLLNQDLQSGCYEIIWKPGDIASGIYIYKITVNKIEQSKKCLFLK